MMADATVSRIKKYNLFFLRKKEKDQNQIGFVYVQMKEFKLVFSEDVLIFGDNMQIV